jgi:hypothetical protein
MSMKPGKDRICGKLDWRARLRVTEADALDPAVRNPDHRHPHGGSIKTCGAAIVKGSEDLGGA